MKKSKRLETLASARKAAMPDVSRLVKRHGRTIVLWCVTQLRDYEKKVKELARVKAEAQRLEREIAK
jgi:hypothetical protein